MRVEACDGGVSVHNVTEMTGMCRNVQASGDFARLTRTFPREIKRWDGDMQPSAVTVKCQTAPQSGSLFDVFLHSCFYIFHVFDLLNKQINQIGDMKRV